MRRLLLCLLLCSSVGAALAQIRWKPGFYIDKAGNKTEGLIQDVGWKNTPTSFSFKTNESSNPQKILATDIDEFGVDGTYYVRIRGRFDQSATSNLKNVGVTSGPEWAPLDALLRVVVDGKAKLYHYEEGNYSLFFFSVDGSTVEQLVFKNYLKPDDITQMLSNRMYLSQINSRVKCPGNPPVKENQVPYQLRALERYFRIFNDCSGEVGNVVASSNTQQFDFRLTPGIDFNSMLCVRPSGIEFNYVDMKNLRVGLDWEFVLPVRKGKWAVVAEPTYQGFTTESTSTSYMKYISIETPIGLRHKFFLGNDGYIFVNAMGLLDFPIKFHHEFRSFNQRLVVDEVSGKVGYALGLGVAYKKFSLETRYYSERKKILEDVMTYTYNKSTIILGFKIF